MNRNRRINLFIKGLLDKGITIALAESMTCGLAAHLLSTCKGTSQVLKGSVVCYNEEMKRDLMKVPQAMIRKYSAESPQVTEKLAKTLKQLVSADVHAAITGLASAGGSERTGKPVGTVFFVVLHRGNVFSARKVFRGTPLEVRVKACLFLYDFISKVVSAGSS